MSPQNSACNPELIHFGPDAFCVRVLDLPNKGQDRYLVRDGFAAVADGASPVKAGGMDVGEFAELCLYTIADSIAAGEGLRAAVRAAIKTVGLAAPDAAATPAATLVAVSHRDGELHFGSFCDASALVLLRDGKIRRTRPDPELARWDNESSKLMRERILAGDDLTTARAHCSVDEHLVAQRYSKNCPGGYWLLADEPAAADHLRQMCLPLASVEAMILGSDGFFRLLDLFGLGARQVFAIARSGHLDTLGLILRDLETSAPFAHFSRVSLYDDATAILLDRQTD